MGENTGAPSKNYTLNILSRICEKHIHIFPGEKTYILNNTIFKGISINGFFKPFITGVKNFYLKPVSHYNFTKSVIKTVKELPLKNALILGFTFQTIFILKKLKSKFTRVVLREFGMGVDTSFYKNPLKRYYNYEIPTTFSSNIDGIILTDDGTCGNMYRERFAFPNKKFFFIKNGIPEELLKNYNKPQIKHSLNLPSNIPIILSSGRIVSLKRFDRVVKVAKHIKNAQFIVIGNGNRKKEIVKLAEGIKNIQFLPALKREKYFMYLKASDIFLSLHNLSNIGNTTLEAMATGKPVVAYNKSCTSSTIRHNINGLLVNSVEEAITYTNRLLRNETLQYQLGTKARETIIKNYPSLKFRLKMEENILKNIYENSP